MLLDVKIRVDQKMEGHGKVENKRYERVMLLQVYSDMSRVISGRENYFDC